MESVSGKKRKREKIYKELKPFQTKSASVYVRLPLRGSLASLTRSVLVGMNWLGVYSRL